MRKKLTVLVFIGLAFVLLSGPALAAGSARDAYLAKQGPGRKAHVISLNGTVVGINMRDGKRESITVRVGMTNKAFRSFRGALATVYPMPGTTYIWWDGLVRDRTKTFDDLKVGQKVCINGLVISETNYEIKARRIEVNKPRKR